MPFPIRFQLGDFARIPKALQDFYEDIENFRPFFKTKFIPEYLADVNRNFEEEGSAVGGWEELSPRYAEWKRQRYGNKPINVRTGWLKRSFSPKGRSKDFFVEIERRQLRLGTKVPHALWVNAQRRFMLNFRDLDQKKYMRMLGLYVIELAKQSGLVKSGGPRGR